MLNSMVSPFGFPAVCRKKVTAGFDGGRLTSDGGVLLLSLAERHRGIADCLAGLIIDRRNPLLVTHSVADILRARILAIACGYEDADDLDHLRSDPGFKLACGRLPDSGGDLCSQPTVSRWENMPSLREVIRLTYAMIDLYCASYPHPPASVTLDIDDTVDVVRSLPPRRRGAISNSRCSMRITMSAASCRSMSTIPPRRARWRSCCGRARRHRGWRFVTICAD